MSLTSANGEEEGQPEPDLSLKNSKGDGRIFCFTARRRSAMDGRARRACELRPDAANRSQKHLA